MAVDELHANIGLRGTASRFCRQSAVASRVWAGFFTAMAEGGEGEDEIQFLRTVSKAVWMRFGLQSPIDASGGSGRSASIKRNPLIQLGIFADKFAGAVRFWPRVYTTDDYYYFFFLIVWKLSQVAHLSTGLWMWRISMRLPSAGARAKKKKRLNAPLRSRNTPPPRFPPSIVQNPVFFILYCKNNHYYFSWLPSWGEFQ